MAYFGLTCCTFIPLMIGYLMYETGHNEDLTVLIVLFGFMSLIYWLLITTAIVGFGIKKYVELGNMDAFLNEFLRHSIE